MNESMIKMRDPMSLCHPVGICNRRRERGSHKRRERVIEGEREVHIHMRERGIHTYI